MQKPSPCHLLLLGIPLPFTCHLESLEGKKKRKGKVSNPSSSLHVLFLAWRVHVFVCCLLLGSYEYSSRTQRLDHQRNRICKRASTSVIGGASDRVSSVWIPIEAGCLNDFEGNLRYPNLIYSKKELVHKVYANFIF